MTSRSLEEGEVEDEINWKEKYEEEMLKNKKLVTDMKHLEDQIYDMKEDARKDINEIRRLERRLDGALDAIDRKYKEIGKNHKQISEYEKMAQRDGEKIRSLKAKLNESRQEVLTLKQAQSKDFFQMQRSMYQGMPFSVPPSMPPGMPPSMPPGMPPSMPPDVYNPEQNYFENHNVDTSRKRSRDDEDEYQKVVKPRCWHYGKAEGCLRGETCKFLHE